MALRGRSALRVLRDLMAVRLEFPSTTRLSMETWWEDWFVSIESICALREPVKIEKKYGIFHFF